MLPRHVLAVVMAALAAPAAHARTILVNAEGTGDYPTIQAAVDAAVDNDTILCANGTYTGAGNRDILVAKPITLQSQNGPANCIVNCQGTSSDYHRGFTLSAGAVLEGFTVENGYMSGGQGGAIHCTASTVRDCILRNNSAKEGGGLYLAYDRSLVEKCIIADNRAMNGGGIFGRPAGGAADPAQVHSIIRNCLISGNGYYQGSTGGGLYLSYGGSLQVTNCTIVGNRASTGAALHCECTFVWFENSIMWNNAGTSDLPIVFSYGPYGRSGPRLVCFSYCNIQDGKQAVSTYGISADEFEWGPGNTECDPAFVIPGHWEDWLGTPGWPNDDRWVGDFHLNPVSPCIDAGMNDALGDVPETDCEGNPRLVDGDNDGQVRVDMGAFESPLHAAPVLRLSIPVKMQISAPDRDPARNIQIRNGGGGVLNWTIEGDCPWLEFAPAQGTSSGEWNETVLNVLTDDLPDGFYECQFAVSAEGAVNSPVTVDLTLHLGTLKVPQEYATIQAAIIDAMDDDVIVVADGVYSDAGNTQIDLMGKAVTVRSENGPENCIIHIPDGTSKWHTGFILQMREDRDTVIQGFTVENGRGLFYVGKDWNYEPAMPGGAMICLDASPSILDCRFRNNYSNIGGAVFLWGDSHLLFDNCRFTGNSSSAQNGWDGDNGSGAAIYVNADSSARLDRCTFLQNSGSSGGAVANSGEVEAIDCLFVANNGYDGGAVYNFGTFLARRCVFAGNIARRDGGAIANGRRELHYVACALTIDDCAIEDNWAAAWGGGVFCNGLTTMRHTTVRANRASECVGGLYVHITDQKRVISKTIITDNLANGATAGWVTSLENCYISGNEGTGIEYLIAPNAVHCLIENNEDDIGQPRVPNGSLVRPFLTVSKAYVNLARPLSGLESAQLEIAKAGPGDVNWHIVSDCPWLRIQPTNGTVRDDPSIVTVAYDPNLVAEGLHYCTFKVVDPNSANEYVTVFVDLRIGRLYHVPQDFLTIQEAMAAADDFSQDVILVADGTHQGLKINDCQAIIIRSENGPADCHLTSLSNEPYPTSLSGLNTVIDGFTSDSEMRLSNYPDQGGFGLTLKNVNARARIRCWDVSMMFENCVFMNATATPVSLDRSVVQFVGCRFENNSGLYGGAIDAADSLLRIDNSTFQGNTTESAGGAILSQGSLMFLRACAFQDNTAVQTGGAISSTSGAVLAQDSVFRNNAASSGGAVYASVPSSEALAFVARDCTFIANTADIWGALRANPGMLMNSIIAGNRGGGVGVSAGTVDRCTVFGNIRGYDVWCGSLINSICRENFLDDLRQVPAQGGAGIGPTTVSFCCMQLPCPGVGNTSADPIFADPGRWDDNGTPEDPDDNFWVDGDYHLKSQAGRWDAASESWVNDDVTSRCIDAGSPSYPLGDEPADADNVRIDMGAYGGMAEASKTPAGWSLLSDITNDGLVSLSDFAAQAGDYARTAAHPAGDLDRSGTVDINDVALLASQWLEQTSWCELEIMP